MPFVQCENGPRSLHRNDHCPSAEVLANLAYKTWPCSRTGICLKVILSQTRNRINALVQVVRGKPMVPTNRSTILTYCAQVHFASVGVSVYLEAPSIMLVVHISQLAASLVTLAHFDVSPYSRAQQASIANFEELQSLLLTLSILIKEVINLGSIQRSTGRGDRRLRHGDW